LDALRSDDDRLKEEEGGKKEESKEGRGGLLKVVGLRSSGQAVQRVTIARKEDWERSERKVGLDFELLPPSFHSFLPYSTVVESSSS
jgi:hypothetical protein